MYRQRERERRKSNQSHEKENVSKYVDWMKEGGEREERDRESKIDIKAEMPRKEN